MASIPKGCPGCGERHITWGKSCPSCGKLCCPNCGRDMLDWTYKCPGCAQVPWASPIGLQITKQRRQRHWWLTSLPVMGLLGLVLAASVCGMMGAIQSPGSMFCPMPGSDPKTRALLEEIAALSGEQPQTALARLSALLQHSDQIIRETAGIAMIRVLKTQLEQPGLSLQDREAALTHLTELHAHASEHLRRAVVWTLVSTGDRRSIPFLIDALSSEHTEERFLAERQLTQLTGEQFGSDRRAWTRWWNTHQNDPPQLSSQPEIR